MKKLKYELTIDQVKLILDIMDQSPIKGIAFMSSILSIVNVFQSPPLNSEDIEKEQYEALKSKFDKK